MAEAVPGRFTFAMLIPGAFYLVGCSCRSPDKIFREVDFVCHYMLRYYFNFLVYKAADHTRRFQRSGIATYIYFPGLFIRDVFLGPQSSQGSQRLELQAAVTNITFHITAHVGILVYRVGGESF